MGGNVINAIKLRQKLVLDNQNRLPFPKKLFS